MQDPHKKVEIDQEVVSDADSDLSEMKTRVMAVVESRRSVLALPSVPVVASRASPVRLTPSDDVDRIERANYMREYYVKAKARRHEAMALARITPRRSPRLAATPKTK